MRSSLLFACIVAAILPSSALGADVITQTWMSNPRGLVTITVDNNGGRIAGPGWEHKFGATARKLDFEIAPGRRFVLHRSGQSWGGEYFHPRIGPGTHRSEIHRMTFSCGSSACSTS